MKPDSQKLIPTEDDECAFFAQWLDLKHYKFSHIVNEAKTKNWGAIMKSKRLGLRPGVPDYLIIKDGIKDAKLLFVEMKRVKGGRLSEPQAVWIEALNRCKGVEAKVCWGADEAIAFVEGA